MSTVLPGLPGVVVFFSPGPPGNAILIERTPTEGKPANGVILG